MSYRDLQFDWLQCLVAVVDAGSLSGAAAEATGTTLAGDL
mgnify:CR=1 FL=1